MIRGDAFSQQRQAPGSRFECDHATGVADSPGRQQRVPADVRPHIHHGVARPDQPHISADSPISHSPNIKVAWVITSSLGSR